MARLEAQHREKIRRRKTFQKFINQNLREQCRCFDSRPMMDIFWAMPNNRLFVQQNAIERTQDIVKRQWL